MQRPIRQLYRRPSDAGATLAFGRFSLRLLMVFLVGLWILVQMPAWAPGPEIPTISSPIHGDMAASEAERFDTPAGAEQRLRLKAMMACQPSITKDPDWHPPDLAGPGPLVLHAGTRGSAAIPAGRVRQTAVALSLPYFLRAPPRCG